MCGVLWSKNGGVSNDHRYQHKLFFNRWFEEGEGADYKYWEETIVRDFKGNVIGVCLKQQKVS